jgi:archaeosine synthase
VTEFFEVHDRDGAARVGELRLTESVETPALVDDVLVDGGSLWPADRDPPEGDRSALTVLPHRAFPAGTDGAVEEAFDPEVPDLDHPSAAVVSPTTAGDRGTDAYALSTAGGVVDHPEALVEAVVRTREAVPEDAALYLAGVATPANVPTLAFAGVDLFDEDRAVVAGTRGRYLTSEGLQFLEDLSELPCPCPACDRPRAAFDREACVEHNRRALAAEVRTVRSRIRQGRLREYVEGQARHGTDPTAVLRLLDERWGYVEPRTPVFRGERLLATTEDALRRPEIRRFADRVTSRYRRRFDGPLVLVPCSATKPYGESQSHRQFREAIDYRGHLVSTTSPIGVVPQELELTYPAQQYDSVVTGRWSATEREFVGDVLARYLDRAAYDRAVAHVPEEYRPAVERGFETADADVTVEFTVVDHPTTEASLANLREALAGEDRYGRERRHQNTLRAIADYQFGPGAGDDLLAGAGTESRYPKLRALAGPDTPGVDGDHPADPAVGDQLAAMVPEYGLLALTLAGARAWVASDVPTRRVEIDEFVPHGNVLAPGVVDADESIRPGDEVVVEGPSAFAVGRAEAHGEALVENSRGEAVSVRHVREL